MNGRTSLIVAVMASVLAGSGCVSCGSKGYGLAYEAGPACEVPTCQRNMVYVFCIGGLNPLHTHALDSLREQLNKQGFAKVGTAQTGQSGWVAGEMKCIHKTVPDAVFVLLGVESGGDTAVRLAENARAAGLPVAAVVLIDPDGKTQAPDDGTRVLAVSTGGYGMASSSTVESIIIPRATRHALPSDPRTVATVLQLLNEVALGVPQPVLQDPAFWEYPHAPEPRPSVNPRNSGDWLFLFDQPGGHVRPLGETPMPAVVAKPPVPATATATRRP